MNSKFQGHIEQNGVLLKPALSPRLSGKSIRIRPLLIGGAGILATLSAIFFTFFWFSPSLYRAEIILPEVKASAESDHLSSSFTRGSAKKSSSVFSPLSPVLSASELTSSALAEQANAKLGLEKYREFQQKKSFGEEISLLLDPLLTALNLKKAAPLPSAQDKTTPGFAETRYQERLSVTEIPEEVGGGYRLAFTAQNPELAKAVVLFLTNRLKAFEDGAVQKEKSVSQTKSQSDRKTRRHKEEVTLKKTEAQLQAEIALLKEELEFLYQEDRKEQDYSPFFEAKGQKNEISKALSQNSTTALDAGGRYNSESSESAVLSSGGVEEVSLAEEAAQARLQSVQAQWAALEAHKVALEARMDFLQAFLRSGAEDGALPDLQESQRMQSLFTESIRLQAEIARHALTLRPTHPQMRALNAQLDVYRRQKHTEADRILQALKVQHLIVQAQEAALLEHLKQVAVKTTRESPNAPLLSPSPPLSLAPPPLEVALRQRESQQIYAVLLMEKAEKEVALKLLQKKRKALSEKSTKVSSLENKRPGDLSPFSDSGKIFPKDSSQLSDLVTVVRLPNFFQEQRFLLAGLSLLTGTGFGLFIFRPFPHLTRRWTLSLRFLRRKKHASPARPPESHPRFGAYTAHWIVCASLPLQSAGEEDIRPKRENTSPLFSARAVYEIACRLSKKFYTDCALQKATPQDKLPEPTASLLFVDLCGDDPRFCGRLGIADVLLKNISLTRIVNHDRENGIDYVCAGLSDLLKDPRITQAAVGLLLKALSKNYAQIFLSIGPLQGHATQALFLKEADEIFLMTPDPSRRKLITQTYATLRKHCEARLSLLHISEEKGVRFLFSSPPSAPCAA